MGQKVTFCSNSIFSYDGSMEVCQELWDTNGCSKLKAGKGREALLSKAQKGIQEEAKQKLQVAVLREQSSFTKHKATGARFLSEVSGLSYLQWEATSRIKAQQNLEKKAPQEQIPLLRSSGTWLSAHSL